jgi:hypothetical protein
VGEKFRDRESRRRRWRRRRRRRRRGGSSRHLKQPCPQSCVNRIPPIHPSRIDKSHISKPSLHFVLLFFFSYRLSKIPDMCSAKNKKAFWGHKTRPFVNDKGQENDSILI